MEKIYSIEGMHCNSCANLIEKALKNKVNKVYASFAEEEAIIDFDEHKITEREILEIMHKLGYQAKSMKIMNDNKKIDKIAEDIKELKSETKKIEALEEEIEGREENIEEEINELKNEGRDDNWDDKMGWTILWVIIGIIAIGSIYYLYQNFNLSNIQIPELGERTSLILLFLAGLLTGFHCISMCGGFVVSYTAKNALNGYKGFKQHLVYGGSKVLSYAVIGGLFGLIGGIFAFSIKLRGIVAILAGIFMIFYALSMFGLKFFRRFQLNPKFLTKVSSEVSENAKGHFKAPFFTGLLNGLFLACGPLQAMYLYAAGTGSFFAGATSLAVFGLGTLPVMFGFGSLATIISHKTTGRILKLSAIIVLILGLIMLNRGLSLTGSSFSFESIKSQFINSDISSASSVAVVGGVQEVNMNIDASGYSPNSFVLKKGVPVKWNINVKQLTGCNSELVVGEYDIDKKLKQGTNVIEFTPDKAGTITFTCGMGMLRGSFIVTEDGTATQAQITGEATKNTNSGGSCGGSCGGGRGCGG